MIFNSILCKSSKLYFIINFLWFSKWIYSHISSSLWSLDKKFNWLLIITFLSTSPPNYTENTFKIKQRELQLALEAKQEQDKTDNKKIKTEEKKDKETEKREKEAQELQTKESQIYKNSDTSGIKEGKYKRVANDKIRLTNDLSQWFILIRISSQNYYGSWQGIIGNMYNDGISRGWGLYVNPSGVLHWVFADVGYPSSWDLNKLGALTNGYTYNIRINYRDKILKFTLENLNLGSYKTESLDKMTMITNRGFVTIGGHWLNNNNEKFKGDIQYVEILTTEWELSRYNETYLVNKQSDVTKFRYSKGLCSQVYQPNRNNYYGGTDCGNGDKTYWDGNLTIFDDWRNKGGSCPDWQREDNRCGTGCRWAGGQQHCV